MEYTELADIIFPNSKPISIYEEKYKERNLPEGAMVTRFAPSPTGYVHIGGLYQSIINKKLAEQSKGVFILRIEDTDQKRQIENGTIEIIDALKKFNIEFDEGMVSETEEKGKYGPYKQSLRKEIYQAYAKSLIEKGLAYPCFATQEELNAMREKQEKAKVRLGYYGVWAKYRDLPINRAIEKINNGEPYIIRFKSMGREDRKIRYHDGIKGNIELPENDQDIVIIKTDGLPTYHFAHVVDDHLMRVTHVIRSDEWISSVPIHLQLFNALQFKTPRYLHTASILKEDDGKKRKISKRKDPEAAVNYYHEEGIPTEALYEYLLNIANSNFESWRKQNPKSSILEFHLDAKKMNVSGALFDMNKLLDISKIVISKYSAEDVYKKAWEWAKQYDQSLLKLLKNKEFSIKVLGIERKNERPRKDIAKWSDIKENIKYMYDDEFYSEDVEYMYQKIRDKEIINKILDLYIKKYYDENDDKQTWFKKIKDLTEELGYAREIREFKANPEKYNAHVGDVSSVLRVALTRRVNTPDMYEIMQVLGRDSVLKRLKYAMNK